MWLLILFLFPSIAFAQVVRIDSRTYEEPTRFDVLEIKNRMIERESLNVRDQEAVDQLKARITARNLENEVDVEKLERAAIAGVKEAGQ